MTPPPTKHSYDGIGPIGCILIGLLGVFVAVGIIGGVMYFAREVFGSAT